MNTEPLLPPNGRTRLIDIAKVLRSKNAGPFLIAVDILFDDFELYDALREQHLITPPAIAALYNVERSSVVGVYWFERALAVKIVLARTASSGSVFDRDVYGAQQHAPLLHLELTMPLAPRRSTVEDVQCEEP